MGNTLAAGAAAEAGVPKLKPAGGAVVAGVLKEKSAAGWLLAGVCAALPKLKPPDGAGVKEKPAAVVVVAAAVFGVPNVKPPPPPAEAEPKLNWFMAERPGRRGTGGTRGLPRARHGARPQHPPAARPRRAR